MPKRVTITLDDRIYEDIQTFRGKLISQTKQSISISRVINMLLNAALKHIKMLEADLKECPNCFALVDKSEKRCPHCGEFLEGEVNG